MSFSGVQPTRFITPGKVLQKRKDSYDKERQYMNMTGGFQQGKVSSRLIEEAWNRQAAYPAKIG